MTNITLKKTTIEAMVDINPGKSKVIARNDNEPTSFIGMEDVDETTGTVHKTQTRDFSTVKKGYTYFENGDIIFAKITPCMQNGKSAIVENLIGGFGYGSTEFVVLRAKPGISNKWILHFLRTAEFRRDAEEHFTGSAGQQRVPSDYIEKHSILYPSNPDDVDKLLEAMGGKIAASNRLCDSVKKQEEAVNALQDSILREAFPYKAGDKLPDGWKWEPLSKVIKLKSGSTVTKTDENGHGDLPYVRVSDMNSNGNESGITSSATYVKRMRKYEKQVIPSGSVIFPKRGGAIATNKKRLIKMDILADSNIMAAICTGVDVNYFYMWFQMLKLEDLTSGSSVPQINNPDLYKLSIPMPVDIKKQAILAEHIKNKLANVKDVNFVVTKQKEAVEALPSAILRQTFAFN